MPLAPAIAAPRTALRQTSLRAARPPQDHARHQHHHQPAGRQFDHPAPAIVLQQARMQLLGPVAETLAAGQAAQHARVIRIHVDNDGLRGQAKLRLDGRGMPAMARVFILRATGRRERHLHRVASLERRHHMLHFPAARRRPFRCRHGSIQRQHGALRRHMIEVPIQPCLDLRREHIQHARQGGHQRKWRGDQRGPEVEAPVQAFAARDEKGMIVHGHPHSAL
ncbi:hypothetical protein JaAD80_16565 [Janthinobacterium sp. AD80]|nr:hypothetical protein JaAD80_16565 [Janthinobacterium sp. AD80]